MEIIYAGKDSFDNLVKENVLVEFYTDDCGPCILLDNVFETIKEDIQIIKINALENRSLSKKYGVMSVPTLLYFKGGSYNKKYGYMNKEDILKWIEK